MQNVHFTPPQLAQLFGVNVSTIKRWVDSGKLTAEISPGGHRRIHKDHLARFLAGQKKYAQHSYVLRRLLQKKLAHTYTWKQFFHSLRDNEIHSVEEVIDKLFLVSANIPELLDTIIAPTLAYIGEQWSSGKLSIFEEHRLSFLIRMQLLRLDHLIPNPPASSPKAILACVSKEQHEIPLQMLAIVLKLSHITPVIIGINTPLVEIIKASTAIRAKYICLSNVYSDAASFNYLRAAEVFARQHKMRLLYGGKGWGEEVSPRNWKKSSAARYITDLRSLFRYLTS